MKSDASENSKMVSEGKLVSEFRHQSKSKQHELLLKRLRALENKLLPDKNWNAWLVTGRNE